MHPLLIACALTAVVATGAAQDLRDRIELEAGGEVRGRVVTPFAADEVLVLQGQKRVRVPRAKIKAIETITLDVATVLDKRLDAKRNPRFHWMIAEFATSRNLPELAQLEALETVLLDPTHADAHRLLGHREHPKKGWLWPLDRRFVPFDELETHHAKWGRALELASPHFTIRTSAGHRVAIDTLFDLERLYVHMLTEYGPALQLREAIEPMQVAVYGDERSFPARGDVAIPYFEPKPFSDTGWSFVRQPGVRPDDLFTLGTQMILYRCLAADAPVGEPTARFAAWAELGLGRAMQCRLRGDPGLAIAASPQIDAVDLDLARNFRRYKLPNLLHLTLRDHFYGSLDGTLNVHWASAHAFVEFLLDPKPDPKRPARFLDYLRVALGEAKGDSSSAFDKALGVEVEDLEQPFDAWLASQGAPKRVVIR